MKNILFYIILTTLQAILDSTKPTKFGSNWERERLKKEKKEIKMSTESHHTQEHDFPLFKNKSSGKNQIDNNQRNQSNVRD